MFISLLSDVSDVVFDRPSIRGLIFSYEDVNNLSDTTVNLKHTCRILVHLKYTGCELDPPKVKSYSFLHRYSIGRRLRVEEVSTEIPLPPNLTFSHLRRVCRMM